MQKKNPSNPPFNSVLWPRSFMALLLLGIFLGGCSLFSSRPYISKNNRDKSYQVDFQDQSWEKIKDFPADEAFQHTQTQNIMYSNSTCKNVEDSPLEVLAGNILSGLDFAPEQTQVLLNQAETYQGWPAIHKFVRLHSAEATQFVRMLVVKKDSCLYDFVLITNETPPGSHEEQSFVRFLNSIRFD